MWLLTAIFGQNGGICFLLLLTQANFFGATFYFLERRKLLNYSTYFLESTPCLEKGATLFFALTLPNADRFSKLFHRQTYP